MPAIRRRKKHAAAHVMCAQDGRGADGLWKGADALVVDSGGKDDKAVYKRSGSLQLWLLGYEFTDTVLVFCNRSVHALTTNKKSAPRAQLPAATCRPLGGGRCWYRRI